MNETQMVKHILIEIGLRYPSSVRAWRQNTGALPDSTGRLIRFGLVGAGDISGIMAPIGRRLEIEVKTPKGYATVKQKAFGAMINRMGGLWFVARSFEDVVEKIDEAVSKEVDGSWT